MVSVPKYGGGATTVQPTNDPFSYQSIPTSPQDFGADVGQALVGVGQQVSQFADVVTKHAEEYQGREDSLQARNALISAREKLGLMEAGYQQQEGMNAHQGFQPYTAGVKKLREDSVKGLNPRAADIFGRSFDPQISQALDSGANHAAKQFRVVETAQATAITQQAINDAGVDPLDERRFNQNIAQIRSETYTEATKGGVSPAQADEQAGRYMSVAWQNRLVTLGRTDPNGAFRMFNENKDKITDPNVKYNIENYLNTQRNTIGNAQAVEDITSGRPPGTSDGKRYLSTLPGNTGNAAVSGLVPQFADQLAALHQAAVKAGIPGAGKVGLLSGYRSFEQQRVLNWNKRLFFSKQTGLPPESPTVGALAAHWVADAGESEHNFGTSGDLSFAGDWFQKGASPQLRKYYQDHAAEYGLQFRMGHEPWHISLIGPAGKGQAYTPGRAPGQAEVNANLTPQFQSWYDQTESRHNLPPRLLWAQGKQESNFHPQARGDNGASLGIAQFKAETGRSVGLEPEERFDPKLSIEAQGRLMAYYMKKSGGNVDYALAAYNGGEGYADKWLASGGQFADLKPGVQDYITKIKGFMGGGPGGTVLTPQSAGNPQTLDFHIQQAKDYAVANGYNAYQTQALVQDVRTRHETVRAEGERIEQSNSMAVQGAIMGPPTGNQAPLVSRDQLPERERQIYNAMPPDRRAAMDAIFAANSAAQNKPRAVTNEMNDEHARYLGMRLNNLGDFQKAAVSGEISHNPLLTQDWKNELLKEAFDPNTYKSETGAQLIQSLIPAGPMLLGAKINLHPTKEQEDNMTPAEIARNQQFLGRWSEVSQAYANAHSGRSPLGDPSWVIDQVGYMLRPVTVDVETTQTFAGALGGPGHAVTWMLDWLPGVSRDWLESLPAGQSYMKPTQVEPFTIRRLQAPSAEYIKDIPPESRRLMERAHELKVLKAQAEGKPPPESLTPQLMIEMYYKNLTEYPVMGER